MCKNDVKNCENVVMDTSCNAQTKEIDPQRIFGVHLQREPEVFRYYTDNHQIKELFRPHLNLKNMLPITRPALPICTMIQKPSKCEVKVHNTRIYLPINST